MKKRKLTNRKRVVLVSWRILKSGGRAHAVQNWKTGKEMWSAICGIAGFDGGEDNNCDKCKNCLRELKPANAPDEQDSKSPAIPPLPPAPGSVDCDAGAIALLRYLPIRELEAAYYLAKLNETEGGSTERPK